MLRKCSTYVITKNIMLSTMQPISSSLNGNLSSKFNLTEGMKEERPTVVLLEYMNAQKKHMKKFCNIYLDRGFDVLQISLKPLQLMLPVRGSQVVAKDLAELLLTNSLFSPLVIHAFSVGAYLWSETLVHFENDKNRYQSVLDRIIGQIFDSPADMEAIPIAFPSSIFPNNSLLRTTFQKYLRFHLAYFHESVTSHYLKARETFTGGLIKAPTLFITSNADDLSSPASVIKAKDEILKQKLEVSIKIFDGSRHVMHFKSYPKEYTSELDTFLNSIKPSNHTVLKAKL